MLIKLKKLLLLRHDTAVNILLIIYRALYRAINYYAERFSFIEYITSLSL